MTHIWYEREKLSYFDEVVTYKDYALVNQLYEDDDVRKNTWMWGKIDGDYVVDVIMLEDLSSPSYAPWREVFSVFCKKVDERG